MKICIEQACKVRPIIKNRNHSIRSHSHTPSYSSTKAANVLLYFSLPSLTPKCTPSSSSASASLASSSIIPSLSFRVLSSRSVLFLIIYIVTFLAQRSYAVPASAKPQPTKLISPQKVPQTNGFDTTVLSLESLLASPNLEDAIQRLTDAWHSANADANNATPTRKILISNLIASTGVSSSKALDTPTLIPQKYIANDTSQHHSRDRRSATHSPGHGHSQSHSSQIHSDSPAIVEPDFANNCTKCREKDEARAMRIEAIKQGILSKLGFERAPNVSARSLPKIPPFSHILDQFQLSETFGSSMNLNDFKTKHGTASENEKPYNSYRKRHANLDYFGPLRLEQDSIAEEYFVSAEKSFVFAQKVPEERIVEREHRAQWFAFPGSIANSHVERATLWIYINRSQDSLQTTAQGSVVIYQIARDKPSLLMVQKKKLNHSEVQQGGWIQIDITTMVERWFIGHENLGLSIHSWDSRGKTLPVIHSEDVPSDSESRPFIEVSVGSPVDSKRNKRSTTLTCDEKTDEVRCCRYPLTIDFVEFGWEWIIAPKRYEANYCSGECNLFSMTGAFPHTHLVRQTAASNPNSLNGNGSNRNGKGIHDKSFGSQRGGCCSPRKMSPISMLYLDNNLNVIYGVLPNMVVDQCDCS